MSFRQQLDAVLRTRDVQKVRNFLIAKEQWSEELPADPEFAMWMMRTQSDLIYISWLVKRTPMESRYT